MASLQCQPFGQAERTALALNRHHPELKDIWGDVEANIPIIQPTMADQPANLKLTLLPFQRESLFWMRKQEQGECHGGMLAVRELHLLPFKLDNIFSSGRNGVMTCIL